MADSPPTGISGELEMGRVDSFVSVIQDFASSFADRYVAFTERPGLCKLEHSFEDRIADDQKQADALNALTSIGLMATSGAVLAREVRDQDPRPVRTALALTGLATGVYSALETHKMRKESKANAAIINEAEEIVRNEASIGENHG